MDGFAKDALEVLKTAAVPVFGLWAAIVTGRYLLRTKSVEVQAPQAMAAVEDKKAATDARRVDLEEAKFQAEKTQHLIAHLEKRMDEARAEAREERERARAEREEMRIELRGLRTENATITTEVRSLRWRVEQLVRQIRAMGQEPVPPTAPPDA